jgi:hypothetical protein
MLVAADLQLRESFPPEVGSMRPLRSSALAMLGLLITASGAAAEEAEDAPPPRIRRHAEILAQLDRPSDETGWLALHLERIQIHRRAGFAYTRPLSLRKRPLEFTLSGPAMRRKRVGLSFELRF